MIACNMQTRTKQQHCNRKPSPHSLVILSIWPSPQKKSCFAAVCVDLTCCSAQKNLRKVTPLFPACTHATRCSAIPRRSQRSCTYCTCKGVPVRSRRNCVVSSRTVMLNKDASFFNLSKQSQTPRQSQRRQHVAWYDRQHQIVKRGYSSPRHAPHQRGAAT